MGLQRLGMRSLVATVMSRRLSKSAQLADWQQLQLSPECALTFVCMSAHTRGASAAMPMTHEVMPHHHLFLKVMLVSLGKCLQRRCPLPQAQHR
jgi:hypothetical protein